MDILTCLFFFFFLHQQCQSEQQPKPVNVPADDDLSTFDLTTPRHNGVGGSKRPWEYNVPNTSMLSEEEEKMPEMPNLQSLLGMSLQSVSYCKHFCSLTRNVFFL